MCNAISTQRRPRTTKKTTSDCLRWGKTWAKAHRSVTHIFWSARDGRWPKLPKYTQTMFTELVRWAAKGRERMISNKLGFFFVVDLFNFATSAHGENSPHFFGIRTLENGYNVKTNWAVINHSTKLANTTKQPTTVHPKASRISAVVCLWAWLKWLDTYHKWGCPWWRHPCSRK